MDEPGFGAEASFPRFASRGRAFVYVLPCREEDILKVGFSRDPLQRLRTLHRRFYDFFDLDRALLVETDHLRDARAIERLLITGLADHRVLAPLVVPRSARTTNLACSTRPTRDGYRCRSAPDRHL